VEIANDIDGAVTTFYRTLRDQRPALEELIRNTPYAKLELAAAVDDPVLPDLERARRFFVRTNQRFAGNSTGSWTKTMKSYARPSNGTKWTTFTDRLDAVARRLHSVQIDSTDAISLIASVVNATDSTMAIYADPPYLKSTRNGSAYDNEVDLSHHVDLITLLSAHTGPVVLSGYPSDLYTDLMAPYDWHRHDISVRASGQSGKGNTISRTEVLWSRNCSTELLA
jgi:DNA adenine methylase